MATDRRTAEELQEENAELRALVAELERFRIVVVYSNDWTWWARADGSLSYCSPACEEITGYPAAAFLARRGLIEELMDPRDLDAWRAHKAEDSPTRHTVRFRVRTRKGEVRWVEHSCRKVVDIEGNVLGRSASNRDVTDRVRVDEALQANEQMYRLLAEHSRDIIWKADPDLTLTYVSPSVEQVLGYRPEELIGASHEVFLPRETRERVAKLAEAFLARPPTARERFFRLELTHIHKSGALVDVEVSATVIDDENGNLVAATGSTRVITERKRTEVRLLQSEARFRTLAESGAAGVYQTDCEGRIRYVNPRWSQTAGLPSAEALGNKWLEGVHPDDQAAVRSAWARKRSGRAQEIEYRFGRPGERVLWVLDVASAIRDAEGQVEGYIGTTIDVTARRAAEQTGRELMRQLRQFHSIVSASPAVVFLRSLTPGEPVAFVSDNIIQFGYSPDQLMAGDMDWWDIVHPSDRRRLSTQEKRHILAGANVYPQVYRLRTRDGVLRWIEDHNLVVRNDQGEATHVQGILFDATERKQTEQALRDSQRELKEKGVLLEEKNIALRETLRQMRRERISEELISNLHGTFLPMLERLKTVGTGLDRQYLQLMERSLKSLTDPFATRLESRRFHLTPTEIEICQLLRGGLSSKQAADLLHVSLETIKTHRRNIRKKLGLTGEGSRNLVSFLRSLSVDGDPFALGI